MTSGRLFEGKIVLVTGASSGIGRATAIAFGAAGARVVVSARREVEGEETCALVRAAGGEAIFVAADVTDSAQVARLVARAVEAFGRLDCAFNNAGVTGGGVRFHELDEAASEAVVRANVLGTMLCLKHETAQMLAQGVGSIVNMASAMGIAPSAVVPPAYVASKAAIIGLTKSASMQYARAGIRVNAVAPAWIETPLVEGLRATRPGFDEFTRTLEPIGRIGTPEEVAAAVVWLCSDAASFVTGQTLGLDGGLLAGIPSPSA